MVKAALRTPQQPSLEIPRLGQPGIDRQRAIDQLGGALIPAPFGIVGESLSGVGVRETDQRESRRRVDLTSLLEGLDRGVHARQRFVEQMNSPLRSEEHTSELQS